MAILPTRQLNSVCLADHPELNTAENTDPAARGFCSSVCSSGSGTGSDRQHRTVCGLRHAAKQLSSNQSAFLLRVRVQFLRGHADGNAFCSGVVPGLDHWVALPSTNSHNMARTQMRRGVLHCTALRCAARKIREIHAPLLLDVGCWILAAVIWITDRSSCSLVSFYTMMRPAVHWRGFSYPAPRRRTKIERDREHRLLASPE